MIDTGFGVKFERVDCEDGTMLVIQNDLAKMERVE